VRPRSAGATWQGWDRRARRDRRTRILVAIVAWIVLSFLASAVVIGILTIVGFVIAILG
jgi:hypothetical protein